MSDRPGWSRQQVRDLITHHASGPSPTCDERPIATSEEWGLLKTTAVTWDGWDWTAHKVPPEAFWHNASLEVKAGDVLITKAGPRDRCAVTVYVLSTPPRLMVSGKMILLRPDTSKTNAVVLASALATEQCQRYLDSRTTGMADAQLNFTNSLLLGTYLDLPPLPQQRKIARILTTVDKLIEKTEALIAKYQAIKQGMMHDLFTRGVDEHGRLRPPYEEAPELYKQSELGWIPKEWDVSTLATAAERVVVGLALSVTGSYREKGIPLIRNQNIRRGFFEDDDLLYLDPAFAALFPNKRLLPGDVLTVRTGANVGDTSLFPEKYVGCLTFTTLITTTKKQILCSPYMVSYLDSTLGLSELNRLLVGGGKENLNVGEFVKMRIPLPKVSEQQACVESLKSVATKIESERAALRKLSTTKTGLMQDLLTGKVRVKVDETEEAVRV